MERLWSQVCSYFNIFAIFVYSSSWHSPAVPDTCPWRDDDSFLQEYFVCLQRFEFRSKNQYNSLTLSSIYFLLFRMWHFQVNFLCMWIPRYFTDCGSQTWGIVSSERYHQVIWFFYTDCYAPLFQTKSSEFSYNFVFWRSAYVFISLYNANVTDIYAYYASLRENKCYWIYWLWVEKRSSWK